MIVYEIARALHFFTEKNNRSYVSNFFFLFLIQLRGVEEFK